MTRPKRIVLGEGNQAWDGEADANFAMLTESPLPVYEADTLVDLTNDFPPISYEQCFAIIGNDLYTSDGAAWNPYTGPVADNVPDSTATTIVDMATDFNTLLQALRDVHIMDTV